MPQTVMSESESGFGFKSGVTAFLAGFGSGFRFRPQKGESEFGFKKKWVDSDSNPDSDLCFLVPTSRIFYYGPNYIRMNELLILDVFTPLTA